MEYISTTTLSNELNIPVGELFSKFKDMGWIKRVNDKWILTDIGKQKGGQTRTNQKFGEFIVWPENISINLDNQTTKSKPKLLNATALGKHFNISNQRLNLILSELGWIEKAYIGHDVNGWKVTKLGQSLGGRQFEHDTSGGWYVLWPEVILENKSLNEVFKDQYSENEPSKQEVSAPVITKSNPEISSDYREKYEAKHRTLDGHYVRSRAEVIIDNILYQYGLVHAYERKIFMGDEEVLSDFYLPDGKVYIEFWGLENDEKYLERKKKKIEFYKKNEIPLIELNDEDILNLDDHLPKKLKPYGIKVY